jgi:hypothetical protein
MAILTYLNLNHPHTHVIELVKIELTTESNATKMVALSYSEIVQAMRVVYRYEIN